MLKGAGNIFCVGAYLRVLKSSSTVARYICQLIVRTNGKGVTKPELIQVSSQVASGWGRTQLWLVLLQRPDTLYCMSCTSLTRAVARNNKCRRNIKDPDSIFVKKQAVSVQSSPLRDFFCLVSVPEK